MKTTGQIRVTLLAADNATESLSRASFAIVWLGMVIATRMTPKIPPRAFRVFDVDAA